MLAQRLPSQPAARRAGLAPAKALRSRMADTMRVRAAAGESCTDNDLIAAGFTARDIEVHGRAAAAIAAARSVR